MRYLLPQKTWSSVPVEDPVFLNGGQRQSAMPWICCKREWNNGIFHSESGVISTPRGEIKAGPAGLEFYTMKGSVPKYIKLSALLIFSDTCRCL